MATSRLDKADNTALCWLEFKLRVCHGNYIGIEVYTIELTLMRIGHGDRYLFLLFLSLVPGVMCTPDQMAATVLQRRELR